ncbi:DUF1294 domain-containing protein [Zongyangia hominis]|uniref:DUF1294 domain-containing protein n=1 Tax=Zongyangia hominis TaxID=2763677 RepID=A0A926EB12_9FIRM|nr:DUF1294 domain-containing protein [Zongyangia hominis]MBC8569725.1 DUF1294 domain-containing protein [Zongyangia hominis]
MLYFWTAVGVMNLIAFFVCGWDKRAARKHRRRTPEKTLFLLAALGGSVGLYVGMLLFRHKTRHWYFMAGVPLIILAQAALLVLFHRFVFPLF